MTAPPTHATNSKSKKPTMIVLSHLRWNAVFALMTEKLPKAADAARGKLSIRVAETEEVHV